MPNHEIVAELTDEQEALIPEYREKWRSIENQVESVDRAKVVDTINAAYSISGYSEPEILLYGNPLIAIQEITRIKSFKSYLGRDVRTKFSKRILDHLQHSLIQQLDHNFFIKLQNRITHAEFPYYSTYDKLQPCYFPCSVTTCLEHQLVVDLEKASPELELRDISYFTSYVSRPAQWAAWACMFDFCTSVFKCHYDKNKWQVIRQLIQNCGFLFQYENVCIACDRPSKLSFDDQTETYHD